MKRKLLLGFIFVLVVGFLSAQLAAQIGKLGE
jgi:hypothetical protein